MPMMSTDKFVVALMEALGLPKNCTAFELRCEVGKAVTVRAADPPILDSGWRLVSVLNEFELKEKDGMRGER